MRTLFQTRKPDLAETEQDAEFTDLPRDLELLREIRSPKPATVRDYLGVLCALACSALYFWGGESMRWFAVMMLAIAVLEIFGMQWQRSQKRQQLMADLLRELVTQNHEFRRQVEKLQRGHG